MGGSNTVSVQASFINLMMQLLSMSSKETIVIPKSFHQRVQKIKEYVDNDKSGLVCSLLDFASNCANVPFTVETSNSNFTKLLMNWLDNLNLNLKKVETGIHGLADQYYKERWLRSSLLVLETHWENVSGWLLPTKMFFLDGGSLYTNKDSDVLDLETLGYRLRIGRGTSDQDFRELTDTSNIIYFYQSPYAMWGEPYPSPFLIRRGTYYNSMFLADIKDKGASIAKRVLEHLFLIKKGTEKLALSANTEFIYEEKDYKEMEKNLNKAIDDKQYVSDMAKYFTNFDTDVAHIIPEYEKAIGKKFLEPGEKAILASLGFIEIYNTSERKESILNPKAFISEVEDGVADFHSLISDVIKTVIRVNSSSHRKQVNSDIKINAMPVKSFIDDAIRTALRGLWDRGKLSDRTYAELCGNVDYDIELQRAEKESADGSREIMRPQPARYTDLIAKQKVTKPSEQTDDDIPLDKQGIEKLEYLNAAEGDLEISPYTKVSDLPPSVKDSLPSAAKKIWMEVFNSSYKQHKDETRAIKEAWAAVKNAGYAKNKNGKWVKK